MSYEGGILEDPWRAPYDDMFQLTVAPERAPDRAEEVEIELEAGDPGRGERRAPVAGGAARHASTTIGGRTASAASTSSRTATSA